MIVFHCPVQRMWCRKEIYLYIYNNILLTEHEIFSFRMVFYKQVIFQARFLYYCIGPVLTSDEILLYFRPCVYSPLFRLLISDNIVIFSLISDNILHMQVNTFQPQLVLSNYHSLSILRYDIYDNSPLKL